MKSLLISFLMLIAMPCFSQKAFKPIKTALKAKNYKEAIQSIAKLRNDSAYKDDPKLCLFNIEANRALNDAENTKIYLKNKYDTLSFFSTTYIIVKETMLLDSLENNLEKSEGIRPKQKHLVDELIGMYFPNLQAATRYFYKKKEYAECMKYLRYCIDIPLLERTQGLDLKVSKDLNRTNATLYLLSAYNSKKYAEAHRYEQLILNDSTHSDIVLKYYMLNALEENDSVAFESYARKGCEYYTNQPFFFTHLVDFYNKEKQYDKTLAIAKKQLEVGKLKELAYMANCIAFFETQQYESCINNANNLLQCDSTRIEAHYYLGASYVALAEKIQMPEKLLNTNYRKALKERQNFYEKAEPELELYRKSKPEAKEKWAPLLYKVYLALNRGIKFAEIEKVL